MERLRVEVSVQYDTEHPHAEWSLEPDGDGEVVRYADAQRALNWERERTRETLLQAMGLQQQLATLQAQLESANVLIYKKNCALGRADTTITDLQAQLRQVEGERNTARHRVDELESREIDVEILQGDLATLAAQDAGKGSNASAK